MPLQKIESRSGRYGRYKSRYGIFLWQKVFHEVLDSVHSFWIFLKLHGLWNGAESNERVLCNGKQHTCENVNLFQSIHRCTLWIH